MIDFSDSDLLTLADAAALLGKKTDTLKDWFSKGCPHNRNGRTYEVRIKDVFDWRIGYERQLLIGGDGPDGEVLNLEMERAKLAKAQRIGVEMANATRRGELIEGDGVATAWGVLVMACRAKLLSLGSKVAARVSHPNQRLLAKEIDGEVKIALKELAGTTVEVLSDDD